MAKSNFKFFVAAIVTIITIFTIAIPISMQAYAATTYSVIFPVNNNCTIFRYQKYDPRYKEHDGVDIHSSGDDTIYAAKAGTVVSTCNSCPHISEGFAHKGKYKEEGNYIEIKGEDGIYYWYYHLKQNTLLVSKGDKVAAGQAIATMGSSGISTGKHLHFRMTTGSGYYSNEIIANPVGTYSGQVYYSNGPYNNTTAHNSCADIKAGNYFIKNNNTGTYMQAAGASNKANLTLASKKDANAFKFNVNGSKSAGYFIATNLGTSYVVNPHSDSPSDGTAINIYAKDSSGTQLWEFDKIGSGYVIHLKNNSNLCLTASGTSITLKTRTNAANQIWVLENPVVNYTVTFNANGGICSTANKTVTSGGTYGTLPIPEKNGYTFTGWFTAATGGTQVTDTTKVTITANQTLYAQWTAVKLDWAPHSFKGLGTQEDPYQISNVEELCEMEKLVNNQYYNPEYGNAYYIQTADIDLNGVIWTPIGLGYDDNDDGQVGMGSYNYQTRMFYGVYDGNQHTIYNLTTNKNYKYSGMFGYVRGEKAVIKNLAVEGLIYTKESSSGGGCAGGIAGGLHYGAIIENCAFIGKVTGNTSAGGITGTVWMGGTIKNCYHLGECYSSDATGGISGVVQFGNATTVQALIKNCYHADGTMNSTNAGGIVGKCIPGNEGITNTVILNNCYSEYGSADTSLLSNATSDNTAVFSTDLIKGIATNLGVPFTDNPTTTLYNGYTVFEWQIPVIGDCNNDGAFTMADAVMLQKWLVNDGIQLTNWEAADLDKSHTINVFDLCFMKEMLLNNVK